MSQPVHADCVCGFTSVPTQRVLTAPSLSRGYNHPQDILSTQGKTLSACKCNHSHSQSMGLSHERCGCGCLELAFIGVMQWCDVSGNMQRLGCQSVSVVCRQEHSDFASSSSCFKHTKKHTSISKQFPLWTSVEKFTRNCVLGQKVIAHAVNSRGNPYFWVPVPLSTQGSSGLMPFYESDLWTKGAFQSLYEAFSSATECPFHPDLHQVYLLNCFIHAHVAKST